jgi:hypothetical protein
MRKGQPGDTAVPSSFLYMEFFYYVEEIKQGDESSIQPDSTVPLKAAFRRRASSFLAAIT